MTKLAKLNVLQYNGCEDILEMAQNVSNSHTIQMCVLGQHKLCQF